MLIKNGTVLRGDFTLAREDVLAEGEAYLERFIDGKKAA